MSVTLLRLEADMENSLASAVAVGATSATLSSSVNEDGDTLISGKYGFTIDGDNSAKEFIVCDLVGTALTNVLSIDLQGNSSAGFANYHRIGAVVTITDWTIFQRMYNNLTGVTGFDAGTQLKYDGTPANSDPLAIPTVQFVIDTASGTPVAINSQVIAGDAGENVADGDWVYYNTTDGEWYLTDADDTTKCFNVRIGKARGAGTNGNAITGGIFVDGQETLGTYVAGTTYYLGNTPGALSTSPGTNSVVVGVGDANGELILKRPTPNQTDALLGDGAIPSSLNTYMVKFKSVTAGATINGATLPVPVYQNTTDNEYYACDGNDLATLKFQGFATTNSTDGNPIGVQFNGVVTGFSGLDEGVAYYLSDTVGTIQNTPGTYNVMVGVAISPTSLLIRTGKRVFAGNGGDVGTGTGALVVSCGFRPTIVRIYAMAATTGHVSIMNATYINGVTSAATSCVYNEGTAGLSSNVARLYDADAGADYMAFTISAVTSTGFTIDWTETGTFTGGGFFSYDVEGDF